MSKGILKAGSSSSCPPRGDGRHTQGGVPWKLLRGSGTARNRMTLLPPLPRWWCLLGLGVALSSKGAPENRAELERTSPASSSRAPHRGPTSNGRCGRPAQRTVSCSSPLYYEEEAGKSTKSEQLDKTASMRREAELIVCLLASI